MWNEWEAVHTVHNNTAQSIETLQEQQIQQLEQWRRPRLGRLKCNFDAGFHNNASKMSARWCIRDHTGQFVMAGTSWVQGKFATIQGEVIALLEAMKELGQRGFMNVTFETDSKSIVDAIQRIRVGIFEQDGCSHTC
ncbi:cytochrome p450 [Trifolium pratense]|uniref:Cytochrome p450 n=1 Tax=Trifolium pratense TaxID=57577 RepID=A0A2K3PG82_TRIPR|nr:cytochrome p450 [Trifolium pratense]